MMFRNTLAPIFCLGSLQRPPCPLFGRAARHTLNSVQGHQETPIKSGDCPCVVQSVSGQNKVGWTVVSRTVKPTVQPVQSVQPIPFIHAGAGVRVYTRAYARQYVGGLVLLKTVGLLGRFFSFCGVSLGQAPWTMVDRLDLEVA